MHNELDEGLQNARWQAPRGPQGQTQGCHQVQPSGRLPAEPRSPDTSGRTGQVWGGVKEQVGVGQAAGWLAGWLALALWSENLAPGAAKASHWSEARAARLALAALTPPASVQTGPATLGPEAPSSPSFGHNRMLACMPRR